MTQKDDTRISSMTDAPTKYTIAEIDRIRQYLRLKYSTRTNVSGDGWSRPDSDFIERELRTLLQAGITMANVDSEIANEWAARSDLPSLETLSLITNLPIPR